MLLHLFKFECACRLCSSSAQEVLLSDTRLERIQSLLDDIGVMHALSVCVCVYVCVCVCVCSNTRLERIQSLLDDIGVIRILSVCVCVCMCVCVCAVIHA